VFVAPLWGENIIVVGGAAELHVLSAAERKGHILSYSPPSFAALFQAKDRTAEHHTQFRKVLSPPLARSSLEKMGIFRCMEPIFKDHLTSKRIDQSWIKHTTFDIAWVLNVGNFGLQYKEEAANAYDCFSIGLRSHPYSKDFKNAVASRDIIGRIIEKLVRESPESTSADLNPDALLPVVNTIFDDDAKFTGVAYTPDQRVAEYGAIMVGLLFASHDTLSRAYSGMFWQLIKRPELLERMKEEANRINPPKEAKDLESSEYITHFVKEGLRLYGGSGGFRKAIAPIPFKDKVFPIGTKFFFQEGHEHSTIKDADTFNPDRTDEYKWAPFGGGAHSCLGRHFAIMELKYFLFYLFQNYEVTAHLGPNAALDKVRIRDCYLEAIPKGARA